MPLDPQTKMMLDFIAAAGYPPMSQSSPDAARKGMRAMTSDLVNDGNRVVVGSVTQATIAGPAGEIGVRVFRPVGDGPWPTTMYVHGGGFVVGDLDTHDQTCRRLCTDAATVVVSVDYRLAPEHAFPAAVDDVLAATEWIADHLADFGGTEVFGVAGDSAGGNLCAVAAQRFPERIAAQLLIYPATDAFTDRPSRVENAEGYLLDMATMEWFFAHYLPDLDGFDQEDVRLSPLLAPSLAGLPPAVVGTAEYDPLRDEGEAYADRLAAEGVATDKVRYDGLVHGFLDMTPVSTAADAAVRDLVSRYARLLADAAR